MEGTGSVIVKFTSDFWFWQTCKYSLRWIVFIQVVAMKVDCIVGDIIIEKPSHKKRLVKVLLGK